MDDNNFINQLAEKLSKLGTVRPLGFHYLHPYGTVPADSIICNGATYSRALYKDFFDYITAQGWVKTEAEWQEIAERDNGFCPFYSSGDGSTNFRTPKFAPFMQIAIASGNVGNYHEAGIPNITGEISGIEGAATFTKGAFYLSTTKGVGSGDSDHDNKQIKFDASRESDVYGKSNTVQPESNEWVMCVVAYGIATNVGSVDIQNVMSAVSAVQAQVVEIPKPNAYVTKTWHSGTSWYRKWSDGFIEQGGTSSTGESPVSFHTAFTSTDYTINLTVCSGQSAQAVNVYANANTTTSFKWGRYSGWSGFTIYWYACGY